MNTSELNAFIAEEICVEAVFSNDEKTFIVVFLTGEAVHFSLI